MNQELPPCWKHPDLLCPGECQYLAPPHECLNDRVAQSSFDFLVALRGGLPEACDFCNQPFTAERYPVPEEAGQWACSACEAKWRIKDGSR